MKRLILAALMLGMGTLIGIAFAPSSKANAPRKEIAVVEFPTATKLLNVFLKGEYLIVHDEDKMARGEDCTYVYDYSAGRQGKLVISFHCKPVNREKADRHKISISRLSGSFDVHEIREIQFAGSTEGHQVPQ